MTRHIFLVDDDRFLLDLYAVKFKNAGHEVNVFGTGEDMLAALRKKSVPEPDVILLDLIMPGLGGFSIIEAMHKEGLAPKARIIILSNQGQDSDIEKAKELNVDGYIVKASAIPSEVLAETMRIVGEGAPKETASAV